VERTLLTFGHGTAAQEALVRLLHEAGVGQVIDVRRFPGSRRSPHVARDALEQWLPQAGIGYRWEQRLGGRRRTPSDEQELDPWWRVDAFRAYAAHTRTPEFTAGMADLLDDLERVDAGQPAIMCSESLWWRCHRRLVSDVAVLLHGVAVEHLGHDGRRSAHAPSAGARVTPVGLVYDRPDE
jgi:uncharacterized protein (DUF488 family)